MFSFFLARLTSVFILIAVFLPRSAPRPGPGRCCPPPAAAGNGGRSGPAPGRACRPYIRPLCKRLARSAPPRPSRERRFPCCTIGLRMERPAQPSNPVPGGTQEGRGARGEGAPALAPHEERSRPAERDLPAGGRQDLLPGCPALLAPRVSAGDDGFHWDGSSLPGSRCSPARVTRVLPPACGGSSRMFAGVLQPHPGPGQQCPRPEAASRAGGAAPCLGEHRGSTYS